MTNLSEMLSSAVDLMEATAELIYECDHGRTDIVYSDGYENANKAVVDVWNAFMPVGRVVNVTLKREESRAETISKSRMFKGYAAVDIRFTDSDVEETISISELALVDVEVDEEKRSTEPGLVFLP